MKNKSRLITSQLSDDLEVFDITVFGGDEPGRTVLFAAGRGGSPLRHLPLLRNLAEHGCKVIAPHFELLPSLIPTGEQLRSRARRLQLAAKEFLSPNMPVVGMGHSIGATMMLALVGGEAWTLDGGRLCVEPKMNFDRLVLLAPATDFFRGPDALKRVKVPILALVGTKDVITPPAQTEFLRETLSSIAPVKVRLVEGAGHFTFMNELPPGVDDPFPDRDRFLENLAEIVMPPTVA